MGKDFRSLTFIPKIARERKQAVDELLLEYKKTNADFRYIVRNTNADINVLIKRTSEGYSLTYRSLSLEVLGALPRLKTQIRSESDESGDEETHSPGPEDFQA